MTTPKSLRVQFIHGLESSPNGSKARLFAAHFEALTPAMDTSDFEGCVLTQAEAVASFKPDVLVGSSFGGAVAVALLQRKLWSGPTLLLAQAALYYQLEPRFGLERRLPENARVTLVHAIEDEIVPVDHSRELAATGVPPELVELCEVHDDHALSQLVQSGKLIDYVVRASLPYPPETPL
jgi:predicted esterase